MAQQKSSAIFSKYQRFAWLSALAHACESKDQSDAVELAQACMDLGAGRGKLSTQEQLMLHKAFEQSIENLWPDVATLCVKAGADDSRLIMTKLDEIGAGFSKLNLDESERAVKLIQAMRHWGCPLDTSQLTQTASTWIQSDVTGEMLSPLLDLGSNVSLYPIEKNNEFYPNREPDQTSLLAEAIQGARRDHRGLEGFYVQHTPKVYAYGAKRDFGAFKSRFIGRIKTLLDHGSQTTEVAWTPEFGALDAYAWWCQAGAQESLCQEFFDLLDSTGAMAKPTTSSQTPAWMIASAGKMFGCGIENAQILCEALSKRGFDFGDSSLVHQYGHESREMESALNAAIRTRSFDLATAMIEQGADPGIGSAHRIGSSGALSAIAPCSSTLDGVERDARRPGHDSEEIGRLRAAIEAATLAKELPSGHKPNKPRTI